VAIDASGKVVFTPTANYTGATTFDAILSDGQVTTTQTVTVTWRDPVLQGGNAADTLVVNDFGFTLLGGLGNDTLTATGASNLLDGGADDDTLRLNGRFGTLLGGDGADYLEAQVGSDGTLLDGGSGDDCVRTYANDGTLIGGDGADEVRDWGGTSNTLYGGLGDDYMRTYGQNGTLFGGAGMDDMKTYGNFNILDGGDDNDYITTEGNNGTLIGGDGADEVRDWSGTNNTLYGGLGDDYMRTYGQNGMLFGGAGMDDVKSYGNFNVLDGGDGNDYVTTEGNNGTLIGGDGDDEVRDWGGVYNTLFGGLGNDYMRMYGNNGILFGESGSDDLKAYGNNNTLDGGDGDDVLAEAGLDNTLVGGAGNDVALFTTALGEVAITRGDTGSAVVVGPNGTTTLSGIEVVEFADGYVLLDQNNAPITAADSFSVDEDCTLVISAADLLANDRDLEGDSMTIVAVSAGPVALDASGNVVFTPPANFNGTSGFDYTVVDSQGLASTQHVTVTVVGTNDAPIVYSQNYATNVNRPVTLITPALVGNAYDIDGQALSFAGFRNVVGGSATFDAAGNIQFTPSQDFVGVARLEYGVSDGIVTTWTTAPILVQPAAPEQLNVVGGENLVNTTVVGNQGQSNIVALAGGGYVVTWEGPDGNQTGTFARVYAANGTPTTSEFLVNTTTTSWQDESAVAALTDGGFVVTWSSYLQDGSYGGVYAQRFNASGVKVGGEFRANTYTTRDQYYPSVIGLANGGFVIAWGSYLQDGSGDGCYAQRYDAAGAAVGSEFRLNTYTTSSQSKPVLGSLSDGGFVAIWRSSGQDGSGLGIYGQRYTSSGVVVGSEFRVNTTTSRDQTREAVVGLANGGFVVAWSSYLQDGSDYGVYAQQYDASGNKLGTEQLVNTYTSNGQSYPSVTALSDGGYVIGWESYNQDGGGWGVFAQRYKADGTRVAGESQINTTTTNDQWTLKMAALTGGQLVATWTSFNQDYADGSGGVYTQRLTALQPNSPVQSGSSGGDSLVGGFASDTLSGNGGDDVLWGLAGNDTLIGGAGNDTLTGGAGADLYQFSLGDGQDLVQNEGSGSDGDRLQFGSGIAHDQLWFRQIGSALEVSVIGTGDKVTVSDWFVGAANHVGQLQAGDGVTLSEASVSNLIAAMAAMSAPPMGQTQLTAEQHQQLDAVLAANWH
jgi:VCBS repeat-containing protein